MLARTVVAMGLVLAAVSASSASDGQAGPTQPPISSVIAEGETQADELSLIGRWQLERIDYDDKETITPASPEKYRVEFFPGGTLQAQLDCNRGRGGYSVSGSTLKVDAILATLMACGNDSIDREFTKALQTATSFRRADNRLMLSMSNGGGTMHLTLLP